MKKIILSQILAISLILSSYAMVYAKDKTKILVIISPEISQQAVMSSAKGVQIVNEYGKQERGLFDQRCIPAENMLAKALLNNNYQVMTSSDLVSTKKLSAADIKEATLGNFEMVRKAAILNKANVILNGFIDSEVTYEEVLQMKLTKVVTTLSYKIYKTASGDVMFVDNKVYTDAGKSPKTLFSNTLTMMSEDIAKTITGKIPGKVSGDEIKQIAKLQKKYDAKKTAASVSAKKSLAGNGGNAPQIVIVNPPLGRGFSIAQKKRSVKMEGMVIDRSSTGIKFFNINGKPVALDASGGFTYGVELGPGDNSFELAAMSNDGKLVKKEISLSLTDDKIPPKILITQPIITRGFTTIVKDPAASHLTIKGVVEDDTEVLYINVNGKKAVIDKDGKFSSDVAFSPGETKINIVSADIFGNTTKKEFQVSKGKRGLTTSMTKDANPTTAYKPVLWGLAIGVSKYSTSMLDLKYAANDVRSIVDFFEKQSGKLFSEVHFKMLIDKKVTRDNIINSITTHLGKAGPDDVVFIFVAGHGIKHRQTGSYYFVPYDADNDTIVSKGLRMSDFEESVNILSKNVNKVIIAMDTCHSGAMEIGLRGGMSTENIAETLKQASGLYILSASKGGEASMEGEKFKLDRSDSGHGVFTYALLRGMQGKANYDNDMYISLNELFQYVSREVPKLTDGRQHPYLKVSGTDMPLILLKN